MQTYIYMNYETGERLHVDAESFEIAESKMFHTGDEFDLNPNDWELDEIED